LGLRVQGIEKFNHATCAAVLVLAHPLTPADDAPSGNKGFVPDILGFRVHYDDVHLLKTKEPIPPKASPWIPTTRIGVPPESTGCRIEWDAATRAAIDEANDAPDYAVEDSGCSSTVVTSG